MKVLFIAIDVYSRRGGMERFNQRIVRCLREMFPLPHRAIVVSVRDARETATPETERIDFFGCGGSKLAGAARFLLKAIVCQPDVVLLGHVMFAPLVPLVRVVAPRARIALFAHGIEVWGDPTWRKVPALEKRIVRRYLDRIISVSRFTAGRMAACYGIPADRFEILPNAVDVPAPPNGLPNSDAERRRLQSADAHWNLLSVSRLDGHDASKNIDQVIRAMPHIHARFPHAHHYVAGRGRLLPQYEKLARDLGMEKFVHFLPVVDDRLRDQLYAAADLFIMPSSKEGFGIVFLEAWTHRLAVIASNRDAAQEVIRQGVDGLCVEPVPEALAEAVCGLLADPQRLREMGEAGLRHVYEAHTHAQFAERFRGILMRDPLRKHSTGES